MSGARPRVWHLAAIFLASEIGPVLVGGLIFALVVTFGAGPPQPAEGKAGAIEALASTPEGALISIGGMAAVFIGLSLAVGALSRQPFSERLRLGESKLSWLQIGVAAIGSLAVSSTFNAILRAIPDYEDAGVGQFAKLCEQLTGPQLWFATALIGLAAPLGEELLYRGVFQTRLTDRYGARRGLIATSLAFAVAHLSPGYMAFAFAEGLYLGWVSVLARSTRASIIVHAVTNTLAVVTAALGAHQAAAKASPLAALATGAVSLVIGATCIRWLRQTVDVDVEI